MSEISERVIDIICDKAGIPRAEVTMEKNLRNDLGLDSLDAVELFMECEKEWNLAVPDDEAEKLDTVQSLVDLVEKKVSEKK